MSRDLPEELHLIILRHAHAERGEEGGADFDRILSERGRGEAQRIGAQLKIRPDLVMVSSARRTRETYDIVRAGATQLATVAVSYDIALYDASPAAIGHAAAANIAATPALASAPSSAMMVGHNPGVSDLASSLTRSDLEFGTANVAVLRLEKAAAGFHASLGSEPRVGTSAELWTWALRQSSWEILHFLRP